MTLLGTLLKNRRARDAHSAWNLPNLQGPELLIVTSRSFEEGGLIPLEHTRKRIGGKNLSPDLTWSPPPPETTELLLVVEDLDGPISRQPCTAWCSSTRPARLPQPPTPRRAVGAPARHRSANLRSTISRGYHGPDPLKGHGPHRYTFQLFALSGETISTVDGTTLDRVRPRALLSSLTARVTARGRLTGIYER